MYVRRTRFHSVNPQHCVADLTLSAKSSHDEAVALGRLGRFNRLLPHIMHLFVRILFERQLLVVRVIPGRACELMRRRRSQQGQKTEQVRLLVKVGNLWVVNHNRLEVKAPVRHKSVRGRKCHAHDAHRVNYTKHEIHCKTAKCSYTRASNLSPKRGDVHPSTSPATEFSNVCRAGFRVRCPSECQRVTMLT